MTDKIVFKKRIIPNSLHTALVFYHPIALGLYSFISIYENYNNSFYTRDDIYLSYINIVFLLIIVAYQVWILVKPAAVISDGKLNLYRYLWKESVPLDNIYKFDADQTFYIYFRRADGAEDGMYIPIDRADFERMSNILLKSESVPNI